MINVEHSLRAWTVENNIKGILFDLDDTLIKTDVIFFSAVDEVVNLYAKALPQLEVQVITELFSKINIEAFSKRAVNPNRWELVIPTFEQEIGIQNSLADKAFRILADIYKQHPEFVEGAGELLKLLKEWQIKIAIVTHANVAWTLFKLDSLGLSDFFDYVEIVNENRVHKNDQDWLDAAKQINVLPQNILAVGDNVKGDVQAAKRAGMGQVAWIDKKDGWKFYREGELPSGIIVVNRVDKLLSIKSK